MTDLIIRNINKYIAENHIKQTWIADSLGTNKMNISNILNGKKKNVTLDELLEIINVLDLSFEELQKSDFESKVAESPLQNDELLEYVAFCGSIENPQTKETINLVMELIDIIDIFKTANKQVVYR